MRLTFLAPLLALVLSSGAKAQLIIDHANLFGITDTTEIQKQIDEVKKADGVILTVVTIPHSADPKAEALRATQAYGIRSVVLLISLDPRVVYIQPGADLATTFTEAVARGITKKYMVPKLASGDYGGAVILGIAAIRGRLPGEVTTNYLFDFAAVLVAGLFAFLIYRQLRKKQKETLEASAATETYESRVRASSPVRRQRIATPITSPGAAVPAYRGGYYPPPVVVQSSNNDLLTGVLIGDALSRPTTVVEHYHDSAPAYSPSPAPSSDSGGGGGSDFGSSFDSGGGSDFGGGSFDSGGGGSDF